MESHLLHFMLFCPSEGLIISGQFWMVPSQRGSIKKNHLVALGRNKGPPTQFHLDLFFLVNSQKKRYFRVGDRLNRPHDYPDPCQA